MEARLKREKEFHDRRFEQKIDPRQSVWKYYSINIPMDEVFYQTIDANIKQGKMLEYGCARGNISIDYAEKGADIVGIDISDSAISIAKQNAAKKNLTAEFYQMNAEAMDFEDNTFQYVFGRGILHHLDLEKSFGEIARVLLPNGKALFIEPLGHNPVLNLYRKLTPNKRTEDEHPFLMSDIKLLKKYFAEVEVKHFNMFNIFAVPFRNKSYFKKVLNILSGFDKAVMTILPFMKRYSWFVIMELNHPKK